MVKTTNFFFQCTLHAWCLLHYAGEQLTYTVQHDNLSSLSFIASKFSWYWDNNTCLCWRNINISGIEYNIVATSNSILSHLNPPYFYNHLKDICKNLSQVPYTLTSNLANGSLSESCFVCRSNQAMEKVTSYIQLLKCRTLWGKPLVDLSKQHMQSSRMQY